LKIKNDDHEVKKDLELAIDRSKDLLIALNASHNKFSYGGKVDMVCYIIILEYFNMLKPHIEKLIERIKND